MANSTLAAFRNKLRLGQDQKITRGGLHLNIKGVSMKSTQNTAVEKLVKRAAFALALVTTTLASITAQAAPLVFETEATKIIVVRPIDVWRIDPAIGKDSLEEHKNKRVSYVLAHGGAKLNGSPTLFGSASSHPLIKDINNKLEQLGAERTRSVGVNGFYVEEATQVSKELIENLFEYQADIYQQMVISQGNPDELQSKNSRNKVLGVALATATTIVAGQRFGLGLGSQTVLGSGTARDLYSAVSRYDNSISPVEISTFPLDGFKSFEIRRVNPPNRTMGQIIIAYKDEKTEAAEHEALVIAVVALTGANSTTAEIEQARKEDFARRKAIWDKCVADGGGTCKPEPIRRGGG
jgi:hypothetical protein